MCAGSSESLEIFLNELGLEMVVVDAMEAVSIHFTFHGSGDRVHKGRGGSKEERPSDWAPIINHTPCHTL